MDDLDRLAELGRDVERTRALERILDNTSEDYARVTCHNWLIEKDTRYKHALAERIASDLAGWGRVEELEAENDRLRRGRYDALSVYSTDGLLSSEWVARTGKAERERNEAQAKLAAAEERVREYEEAVTNMCNGCDFQGGLECCACPLGAAPARITAPPKEEK